jgi:hypothetical protein
MLYLNEWFPNPAGNDVKGEFIELYNDGNAAVGLTGYALKAENGKKFLLKGRVILAHGYLFLKRSDTKLSLRNTDGGLFLYDPNGAIIDQAHFLDSAPEGKSFSRIDYKMTAAQHFAFTDPTPGTANGAINTTVATRNYLFDTPLNRQLKGADFFAIMMGTAMLLLGLVVYTIKTNEDLSKLFFGRDKETRRTDRGGGFS